jgi:hypothetical protein
MNYSNFNFRMMSKNKDNDQKSCIHSIYDNCMYQALISHMQRQTQDENGCTVPWVMDGETGSENICKTDKNINITFWEAWNRITNQQDDCPVPCNSLLVTLGAKNTEV